MSVIDRLRLSLFGPGPIRFDALRPDRAAEVGRLQAEAGFARDWNESECEALLADPNVHADGIFANGQMAGFIMSRLAADEAEVLTIVTANRLRGLGLATRLLQQHVIGLSHRGIKSLFLEVAEANVPALALYARAGFARVGNRPGYYARSDGTRANALVMALDLDHPGHWP